MEHQVENEKQMSTIERMSLIVFSLYEIGLLYTGVTQQWDAWVLLLMTLCLISSWVLYLIKYKTYSARAMFTTMFVELCLILYALNTHSLIYMIPTLFVIGAIICMYGIVDLVVISNVVQVFLIFLFVLTQRQKLGGDITYVMTQVGNMVIYMFVMYMWVKSRNESAKKTAQMIKDMTKAERSKDDFLATISHEIRTPLNTIYGMSEMAQKQTDIHQIKEGIYNIEVASKNLMAMVNDILDFSELQSGEVELEEEVYNISSTINDVVNMTMAAVTEKNLDVIVDFDSNIPSLMEGDEKKIRRIIMNFITNAIKFTEDGYIGIKVSGRRESYGLNLMISITDTGIGIREADLEKLFTGFGQLETGRNRQAEGVGLGLAISSMLAKKLGGIITVTSKKGVGSTFTLVVPQKIVKQQPVVEINHPEKVSLVAYINMERAELSKTRDAYNLLYQNLEKYIQVSWHMCRNLDELKRRMENEQFTHVFISGAEFEEDRPYFEKISNQVRLLVVASRKEILNKQYGNAMVLPNPIYSLPLVVAINDEYNSKEANRAIKRKKFMAPNAHVLVVDDNLMNIRVIENLLAHYQIRVTYVLSGSEALEKVESMDYDFIFMDHMMPEMDGVETVHRIREKVGSYYQKVPIVALTANAVAGSRKMLLGEGFTDFLEKPVELSVLERVLRRTLPADKIEFYEVREEITEELSVSADTSNISDTTDAEITKEIKDEQQDSLSSGFSNIPEVDIETGILYCGSKDGFYMIVSECVKNTSENAALLQDLYDKKDWPNYIIKIHALKSTMKSIGVLALSDRAKELEFAGKSGEYDVIAEKHNQVVEDYVALMEKLSHVPEVEAFIIVEKPIVQSKEEAVAETDVPNISEEEFNGLFKTFENAMYSLKKEDMLSVLETLENYKVGSQNIQSHLDKMRRKIAQDDLFAAGSDFENLREYLKGGDLT